MGSISRHLASARWAAGAWAEARTRRSLYMIDLRVVASLRWRGRSRVASTTTFFASRQWGSRNDAQQHARPPRAPRASGGLQSLDGAARRAALADAGRAARRRSCSVWELACERGAKPPSRVRPALNFVAKTVSCRWRRGPPTGRPVAGRSSGPLCRGVLEGTCAAAPLTAMARRAPALVLTSARSSQNICPPIMLVIALQSRFVPSSRVVNRTLGSEEELRAVREPDGRRAHLLRGRRVL